MPAKSFNAEGLVATPQILTASDYATAPATEPWVPWNNVYTGTDCNNETSVILSSNNADVWPQWNYTFATGATLITLNTAMNPVTWAAWNNLYVPRIEWAGSEENRAAFTEWRQRAERERKAKQEAMHEAEQKAWRLLCACLSDEQRRDLEAKNCFYLYTKSGKKYRIDKGSQGNVKLIDEAGKIKNGFCAHPIGVPDADAMLAQKLMLETDEAAFLRVANVRPA